MLMGLLVTSPETVLVQSGRIGVIPIGRYSKDLRKRQFRFRLAKG